MAASGTQGRGPPAGPSGLTTAGQSVFAVSPFLADSAFPPAAVPLRQWQEAVGRRALTPHEQAARERYFAAKATLARAKVL